ncbi:Serendipity locus protein alpha [Melipona quadrifasciata]|uniref:Serendipity locus protein alpha n=1 Tax=Melipona quadrifasciata TaxID=166423 RepID=A0A0M9A941_9HYME|nr:Serendipity locus protein alpha [Melipona quadrifasciata]
MPIKTKQIKGILIPIEEQVNKLKELINTNPLIANEPTSRNLALFEHLVRLGEKFDTLSKEEISDYEEMESKITNIVKEFCTLQYMDESIESIDKQMADQVLSTVLNKFKLALETLEKLECLPLKQRLTDCLDYIREMGQANEIEHFQNIKELGTSILELLGPLQIYRKSLNCKKYVCERLCFCLKMIIEILDVSDSLPEDEAFEQENHFVYRMDLVLDILSEMQNKSQQDQIVECKELWFGIEDVFSYAMAIAQVCKPCNFKAITGTCQSIISEYENLKFQLTSESSDTALNNLKLVTICGNSLSAKKRSKNDLSSAIEDFDQIIDKSMQIGLFAIASCKDKNRINQIRNCLASLESLETELISAITTFYLHPDSKEMRANVKLLTGQWQLEVNKLHDAINLVMDSGAYCQIVLDDLQDRISVMSNCLDNRKPVTQAQVQSVVLRSLSLSRQITITINDIGSDIVERQTIMMIRELKAAIFEADAAAKSLLVENATEPQQLRVIKRCELILNVVKRLHPALVAIMNSTMLMNTSYGKNSKGQGDSIHDVSNKFASTIYGLFNDHHHQKSLTYIRTPYTVSSCKSPLSIQTANSVSRKQLNLSCLIPYIKIGREMRTERSVMYKTPNRNDSLNRSLIDTKLKPRNLTSIRQHLFSRDSISSHDDICLSEESINLTGILERFVFSCTNLSATSSKSHHVEKTQHDTAEESDKKSVRRLTESLVECIGTQSEITTGKVDQCSTIGGGDGPSIVDISKTYDDTQRLSKNTEITQERLFGD